jgi:hypothetical protein
LICSSMKYKKNDVLNRIVHRKLRGKRHPGGHLYN